jgi:hypothetical protein
LIDGRVVALAKQAEANGITQDDAEQRLLKALRPTSLIRRFAGPPT